MPRLSIVPPFRTEPDPLHCGHATIPRSPHLLHMPSDLRCICKYVAQTKVNDFNLFSPHRIGKVYMLCRVEANHTVNISVKVGFS
jgi:hypothetical protein